MTGVEVLELLQEAQAAEDAVWRLIANDAADDEVMAAETAACVAFERYAHAATEYENECWMRGPAPRPRVRRRRVSA